MQSQVAARRLTDVSAGIFVRADGSYLLAQRPSGKPYAGYWEFPGGKAGQGESAEQALTRELEEELGVEPLEFYPWMTRTHHYEHASVRLRFFRITAWRGDFVCREFQSICWQRPSDPTMTPMLPANGPILRALQLPAMLGITMAEEVGIETFTANLERALVGGLRGVILREKNLGGDAFTSFVAMALAACRRSGALCILNAEPEVAARLGADGVHLTAARLMRTTARPDLSWCGASCHDEAELAQAARLGLDYVLLGPVRATKSHPGQSPMGWDRFRALISEYPLPAYALGGLSARDQLHAWRQGAQGVAMMRAAWSGT